MNKFLLSLLRVQKSCLSLIILLVFLLLSSALFDFKIAHNITDSLPQKFFFILEGRLPDKFQYVAFKKHNKFYDKAFIKQVIGVEGDRIDVDSHKQVLVYSKHSNKKINAGYIKEESLLGIQLKPIQSTTLGKGYYYVFAPHKDSLDSRYQEIGLITKDHIIGRAVPILFKDLVCFLIVIAVFYWFIIKIINRIYQSNLVKFFCCFLIIALVSQNLWAKDLGTYGTIYDIKEDDLAKVIHEKLLELESTGELKKLQKEQEKKVIERSERPKAIQGIKHAVVDREFTYDPSIIAKKNIYDHQGNIVVQKGKKVNPLSYKSLPQNLLFIDGDSDSQVRWAFDKAQNHPSIIILVRGNIMKMMRNYKTRLYFDQGGYLVRTFRIKHFPAEVSQKGDLLLIKEEAL